MLDTYQVLEQIAGYWDDMTASEQSSLALTLANKTQMEVFSSVVSNFTTAQNALNTSLESEGSALEENNKILDTIQGKTKVFRAELEELVLGKGGLQTVYKRVLDLGIALLKFANSDIGQAVIKITALVAVATLFQNSVVWLIPKVTKLATEIKLVTQIISGLIAMEYGEVTALNAIKFATKELTVAVMENPLLMGFIAVVGVIKLLDKLIVTQKEATEAFDEATRKLEEYNSEIENVKNKIKEVNQEKINTTDEQNLKNLQLESAELERQLILLEKKAEIEADEAEKSANKEWKSIGVDKAQVGVSNKLGDYTTIGSLPTRFQDQIDGLKQLQGLQQQLLKEREEIIAKEGEGSEADKKKLEQINETNEALEKQYSEMQDNVDALEDVKNSTSKHADEAKKLLDVYGDLVVAGNETEVANSDLAKSLKSEEDVYKELGMTADKVEASFGENTEKLEEFQDALANGEYAQAYAIAISNCVQSTDDFSEAIENTLGELQNIEDAYSNLTSVVEEFNNGQISLDSLTDLMTKYPEYIQYLEMEGDTLRINKEGIDAIAEARIKDAEMLAYQTYLKNEDAIATENYNDLVGISGQVSQSFVNATQDEWNALADIINALNAGQKAWDGYWSSESKGAYSGYNSKQVELHKQNVKNLQTSLSVVQKMKGSYGSFTHAVDANTKAKGSNTKATKENTDANKELISTLEAQIKEYERVIKYINKKFDQEIDRIKDLKDAELDSIDARIDALEELRDAQLDAIQDQIDALEKENDALSDQLELQELLNNLAKAKSSKVKIYRGGQFVYDQDFEQVNEAQKALNEYNAKKRLQDQIDALNDYKDQVKKNYNQQIKDLENYRKAREKAWDAQIKYWEDYKQKFNDMVNSYENEQDRLKALELTGIDFEQQGWQTRLGNLQNFVNNYISLLNQLTEAKKKAQAEEYASSASVDTSNGGSGTSKNVKASTTTLKASASKTKKNVAGIAVSGVGRHSTIARAYASGSNYIKADELAVVGEDPHKEIVIGSDLNTNSGVMMNLHKGSGVVPATATSALMSLADNIRANGVNATANDIMSGGDVTNMEIANVNVTANNADEFVQSMREFRMSMVQKAYR